MNSNRLTADEYALTCIECSRHSDSAARGWKVFRADDPDEDDHPTFGVYCPDCADREFGTPFVERQEDS
jgi:hypothetical protein